MNILRVLRIICAFSCDVMKATRFTEEDYKMARRHLKDKGIELYGDYPHAGDYTIIDGDIYAWVVLKYKLPKDYKEKYSK